MKLYKFLPLFLFFSYSASAVPNKEFFVEKCYDNAIKIVNKDFDSYIKDFHPNAEAKEKAKKYLNKMFIKKQLSMMSLLKQQIIKMKNS